MLVDLKLASRRALCLQYLTYAFENRMGKRFELAATTSCIG
jgi:hypothetical protein